MTRKLRRIDIVILMAIFPGPATGATIARRAGLFTGRWLALCSIYPVLLGFEEDGLVASEWRDPLPGETYRRRVYSLTPDGEKTLRDLL